MWNKERAKKLVKRVIKKYGKEIAIEGSDAVLGLEQHLDRMVARVMGVEVDIVTMARQWQVVIERAAITDGIDKVDALLVLEEKDVAEQAKEDLRLKEVEMKLEIDIIEASSTLNTIDSVIEMVCENQEIHLTNELDKEEAIVIEEISMIDCMEGRIDSKNEKEKEMMNIDKKISKISAGISLDKSIWAPKEEMCKNKGDFSVKVAAIRLLGNNAEHREKSLRWSLRGNRHIKKISEKFEKGNQWCVITFDCEKGYTEAKERLENPKEEYERLKFIPIGVQKENSENRSKKEIRKVIGEDEKMKENKTKREKQAQSELKEVFEQRKGKAMQNTTRKLSIEAKEKNRHKQTLKDADEYSSNSNRITVWDLPRWAKRPQVFESVRYFGRVAHIEMFKEEYGKTKAEVDFIPGTVNISELEETWCIPFMRDYLVRISYGSNSIEELKKRNEFTTKLLDLPKDTNEVLLWRQVKRTGAKSLHIFKNNNNNNMRSATIYFSNERDLLNCSRHAVFYYNNKLKWASRREVIINNQEEVEQAQSRKYTSQFKKKVQFKPEEERNKEKFEEERMLGIEGSKGKIIRIEDSDDEEVINSTTETNGSEVVKTKEEKKRVPYLRSRESNTRRKKESIRDLIESLRLLVGKEDFEAEDNYWDQDIPKRS
jgi:hypothetical protein